MIKRRIQPDGRSAKSVQFTSGVYEILHRTTRRRYVGSSAEVEKRLYWHVVMLRKRRHHCSYLQRIWNKYGEDSFEMFLLEKCAPSKLAATEQKHMDADSRYDLVNAQPIARSCRGYRVSAATKAKMREAAIRIASEPEEKKRRSERAKRQHELGNLGRKYYTVRPRLCEKCRKLFAPSRLNTGNISQSKYCPKCRPEHKGGHYVNAVRQV